MGISIRGMRPGDEAAIADIYRDAYGGLRKSLGGTHPDVFVDLAVGKSDADILGEMAGGSTVLVAESDGAVVGFQSFSCTRLNRMFGFTYSRGIYVMRNFQRGKGIGSALRSEVIRRAAAEGFRKLVGFSTPEAVPFHKKNSARFIPLFNKRLRARGCGLVLHYYEVQLRSSALNALPMEASLVWLGGAWAALGGAARRRR